MKIQYLIGGDFGHGETTVSKFDLAKGILQHEPIVKSSKDEEKKVISAICKDRQSGRWKFVLNESDYVNPYLNACLKGRISEIKDDPERVEAFKAFIGLVFDAILDNDNDLTYNPETGEKNFMFFIACPSGWEEKDHNAPKEYIEFFRQVLPAEWVIKESDAAFFKFKEQYAGQTVLIIDIGSSTIDFTAYGDDRLICSFGANEGAHQVERTLLEYIEETEETHPEAYMEVKQWNEAHGNARIRIRQGEELYIREQKENFHTYEKDCIDLSLRCHQLAPLFPNKTKRLLDYTYSRQEFDKIIGTYKQNLRKALLEAKQRLVSKGFTPDTVILSGGASRMTFIEEMLREIFPSSDIETDGHPEYVVSDGIVEYAKVYVLCEESIRKLFEEFCSWADCPDHSLKNPPKTVLAQKIKRSIESAMDAGDAELLQKELTVRYVDPEPTPEADRTAFKYLYDTADDIIAHFSDFAEKFSDIVNGILNRDLNDYFSDKIKELIRTHYKKEIDIRFSVDIDLSDFIKTLRFTLSKPMKNLGWTGWFYFKDRDISRNREVRKEAAEHLVKEYKSYFEGWTVNLGENTMQQIIDQIKTAVHDKIRQTVSENELFKLTK